MFRLLLLLLFSFSTFAGFYEDLNFLKNIVQKNNDILAEINKSKGKKTNEVLKIVGNLKIEDIISIASDYFQFLPVFTPGFKPLLNKEVEVNINAKTIKDFINQFCKDFYCEYDGKYHELIFKRFKVKSLDFSPIGKEKIEQILLDLNIPFTVKEGKFLVKVSPKEEKILEKILKALKKKKSISFGIVEEYSYTPENSITLKGIFSSFEGYIFFIDNNTAVIDKDYTDSFLQALKFYGELKPLKSFFIFGEEKVNPDISFSFKEEKEGYKLSLKVEGKSISITLPQDNLVLVYKAPRKIFFIEFSYIALPKERKKEKDKKKAVKVLEVF